ncbi:Crp/Fnr family transcriptional regulator [Mycolicibacterium bacteremicum]|uniref:CRP-like cAMP-activated global transcriptional regulator n=1 Tax=Mycolicibacterium bacteremicum TaxID=564198 RepID=A0A1W9Z4R3_MYCBA|nr:Crp/Fnr family transcriptional regulator [Mycolicibacterium bacteremicum]MCV7433668.1 Crp/Fnr family transcriptional regulator [Mycolicibacterium bacteremicum]ORA07284.1 Crp/Fnr family transcriptional regulator [Mycolicibacterium bacteremicum]
MNAVLGRTAIFQDVDAEAMAILTQELEFLTFPRNHTIFVEGEPGDRLYVLIEGKVKVGRRSGDGRESLIAVMGPGDTFGELALFDPGPRTATVATLTEVRVAAVPRQALGVWIADRPQIAEQLLRVLARRLRRTNDDLCDMIFTDVPGRVAKQLLDLTKRFGRPDGDGLRVDHELTQLELAQLVGSSRETINKALSEFANRGWIRQQGKTIFVLEPAKLARRAR